MVAYRGRPLPGRLVRGAPGAGAQNLSRSRRAYRRLPFAAGGSTDILARMLGNALGAEWKQPVVIENKPGAGGTFSLPLSLSRAAGRTPADGYLMVTATHHVINPALYKNLRYDSKKDFTPIAQVAAVPNVLVANADFAERNHIRTAADLIAYARARPGKVNFEVGGHGGANHLSGELFKSMTGVNMVHIPYEGAAPALETICWAARFPSCSTRCPASCSTSRPASCAPWA